MKNIIKHLITIIPLILSLVLCFVTPSNKAHADTPDNPSSVSSMQYDYWIKTFPALSDNLQTLNIMRTCADSEEIFPFTKQGTIYGLTLSGSVQLNSEISLVRIILVDVNLHEYLVYETYPLIAGGNSYSVKDVCEETCLLESVKPFSLKIEMADALIHIDKLSISDAPVSGASDLPDIQKNIKESQETEKVARLNDRIKKKGLKWIAGQTSISTLSYEWKNKLFGRNKVPNLQGAEYYKGGVIEVKSPDSKQTVPWNGGSSSLIESFDWRNRHGANNPDLPYYDDDPTGSGWITPVKSQGCNHCWAFSAVGVTEALVNLYFNQHLDLDLSEQDVGSCSGGEIGCCSGGYVSNALDYIGNTGVVDEGCFPYSASCQSCTNKCSHPNEQIRISGRTWAEYNEEAVKRAIINHGPITAGLWSWWHVMVMIGFDKDPDDGQTIWIFKNSWGAEWGENGYGYLKVTFSDLYNMLIISTPIVSLITPHVIACYDRDGDGFYNWGIGPMPPTCPPGIPTQEDCDDSNPNLGPSDANGNCTLLKEAYTLSVSMTGSGTVRSTPVGIHCGYNCSRIFAASEPPVNLTAIPGPGWEFAGWSGACSGTETSCNVRMDGDKNVTADFTPASTETITTPTTLNGPISGTTGTSYSYMASGSTSSLGHTIEYQFDWKGDGSDLSSWGSASQSRTWSAAGSYNVKTRARCTVDSSVMSGWFSGLSVNISAPETVSAPTTLSGPTSGVTGTPYSYVASGSTSSLGHSLEYQFDWKGDNSDLSPWALSLQSKTWDTAGTYNVRVRARCVLDSNLVSSWSGSLSVIISAATLPYIIATNPPGLQIILDGSTYTAPQTLNWTPGSAHTLSATSPHGGTPGTQYVFSSWSDRGPWTHSIIGPSSSTTYIANFTTQYSLTASSNPSGGGSINPPGTNWYDSGQLVSISATATSGYIFSGWSGDLSGKTNPSSLTMDNPKNVTANFGIGPDLTGSWTTPVTQTCRTIGKNQRCTLKGTFTVVNIGNRDASSTHVDFYLSDNGTYKKEGDTKFRSVATGKIKAGKSRIIQLIQNLTTGQNATGKYILGVIDGNNLMAEIDETNNIIVFGPIQ